MGTPKKTDRDLDVFISGDGFFVVQTPNGESAYRRDGTFYRSPTGRIETVDGYPVQPEIIIPGEARKVEISENGTVSVFLNNYDRSTIGQIQLATFINPGGLKASGKNLFIASEASGPANVTVPGQNNAGGLLQRYVETSNVDMVREMTEMIQAQRYFEMNSKVLQAVDQVLQHTVNVR
jgi:flagellar basal-body rod protein FlgG